MTERYEAARQKVQHFLNAKMSGEIIFTSGTTSSINAVAFSFGEQYIKEGDEVLISEMEHHANIVPWQMMCQRRKAKLKIIPFDNNGVLLTGEMENLITERTKIVAITHVSNTLGTINPVKKIIDNLIVTFMFFRGIKFTDPMVLEFFTGKKNTFTRCLLTREVAIWLIALSLRTRPTMSFPLNSRQAPQITLEP